MSLPDTVFIFVLALIIFGPKKLPEIGRQIGKLVGEFRRASNEFKFQIEEELRQVDIMEKSSTRPTIATPVVSETPSAEALQPPVLAEFPADPAANIPIGQHPNIDSVNTVELNVESAGAEPAETPTITPAEGTESRATVPFAATNLHVELPEAVKTAPEAAEVHASAHPAPAEAEITHG